jgi:hypothetical protein
LDELYGVGRRTLFEYGVNASDALTRDELSPAAGSSPAAFNALEKFLDI